MAEEPFISEEDRPDLTIDLEKNLGETTVRELQSILGPAAEFDDITTFKWPFKEFKDFKDRKERKEHKDRKDAKDRKDRKDFKDRKEHKDRKDAKERKERKDFKDRKEWKDRKDLKDRKEFKEPFKERKDIIDKIGKPIPDTKGPQENIPGIPELVSELDKLIQRVSGLEKEVEALRGKRKG